MEDLPMKKDQKPRISQCMIVKNEEENIRKALSWGRDIMWEQIVVDTGSTDRTVEIAKEMGATVYFFSWIDDFAAAKNFACEQAKGDWIAFLDADEYMDSENVKRLSALLTKIHTKRLPYQVVVTNWFNVDENGQVCTGGNQIRFFRNRCGIRYRGRIHEHLVNEKKILTPAEVLNACDSLTIFHTGYIERAMATGEKQERNRRLILKELEEHPNDHVMLGNLADTYRAGKEYEKAIFWYEKAAEAITPADLTRKMLDSRISETLSSLLFLLCSEKKDIHHILDIYEKAIQYVPEESDFDYILGRYLAGEKEYEQAAFHLERALELMNTYGNLCYGSLLTGNLMRAQEYLATCYFNTGRRDRCVNCCVRMLQADRFSMGGLKILLYAFLADAKEAAVTGRAAANGRQVLGFLGKLYNLTELKERLFLWKAACETGYDEFILALRECFSEQELALLDAAAGGEE